jgi:hypothetical protein
VDFPRSTAERALSTAGNPQQLRNAHGSNSKSQLQSSIRQARAANQQIPPRGDVGDGLRARALAWGGGSVRESGGGVGARCFDQGDALGQAILYSKAAFDRGEAWRKARITCGQVTVEVVTRCPFCRYPPEFPVPGSVRGGASSAPTARYRCGRARCSNDSASSIQAAEQFLAMSATT